MDATTLTIEPGSDVEAHTGGGGDQDPAGEGTSAQRPWPRLLVGAAALAVAVLMALALLVLPSLRSAGRDHLSHAQTRPLLLRGGPWRSVVAMLIGPVSVLAAAVALLSDRWWRAVTAFAVGFSPWWVYGWAESVLVKLEPVVGSGMIVGGIAAIAFVPVLVAFVWLLVGSGERTDRLSDRLEALVVVTASGLLVWSWYRPFYEVRSPQAVRSLGDGEVTFGPSTFRGGQLLVWPFHHGVPGFHLADQAAPYVLPPLLIAAVVILIVGIPRRWNVQPARRATIWFAIAGATVAEQLIRLLIIGARQESRPADATPSSVHLTVPDAAILLGAALGFVLASWAALHPRPPREPTPGLARSAARFDDELDEVSVGEPGPPTPG